MRETTALLVDAAAQTKRPQRRVAETLSRTTTAAETGVGKNGLQQPGLSRVHN